MGRNRTNRSRDLLNSIRSEYKGKGPFSSQKQTSISKIRSHSDATITQDGVDMIVGYAVRLESYLLSSPVGIIHSLEDRGFDMSRPIERKVDYETGWVSYTQEAQISLKGFV